MDVDPWRGFFATVNWIGYEEGGIHTNAGTAYAMYRHASDGRFVMIPRDFDALCDVGATRSLFTHSQSRCRTTTPDRSRTDRA